MLWYVVLLKTKTRIQISEMRKSSIAFFFNSDLIILATSWAETAYHLEYL
jgi:hypothetical protein